MRNSLVVCLSILHLDSIRFDSQFNVTLESNVSYSWDGGSWRHGGVAVYNRGSTYMDLCDLVIIADEHYHQHGEAGSILDSRNRQIMHP